MKVAAGYARNFLLPKRLAVAATEVQQEDRRAGTQAYLRREAKVKGDAERSGEADDEVSRDDPPESAGENDQLFGSVTAKDIADALEARSSTSTAARCSSTSPSGRWANTRCRCGYTATSTVE